MGACAPRWENIWSQGTCNRRLLDWWDEELMPPMRGLPVKMRRLAAAKRLKHLPRSGVEGDRFTFTPWSKCLRWIAGFRPAAQDQMADGEVEGSGVDGGAGARASRGDTSTARWRGRRQ